MFIVSFEVFGDGKLLYAKHFSEDTFGYYPENFTVDLTGVLEMEVRQNCAHSDYNIAIGDCGLWT